jgi:hypothetical protein
LSYANIVASVALFMALGGVSYAASTAATNSVRSSSIKNGQVKNADLGANAVTSVKIADGQVKGADVLESSLGRVPSAANAAHATNADLAADANTVGGLAPTVFVQKSDLLNSPLLTGHFSCAGSAWESVSSTATYTATGSEKHGTAGAPLFRCNVAVPDGTTITAVNFTVRDTSATDNVDCDLWRTNMVTAVGGELLLANATTTLAPGDVRVSDATVTQGAVDNDNFSYFVQCATGPDATTGVFGANLTYTAGGAVAAARLVPAPAGTAGSSSAR